jgi:hypothetical protein
MNEEVLFMLLVFFFFTFLSFYFFNCEKRKGHLPYTPNASMGAGADVKTTVVVVAITNFTNTATIEPVLTHITLKPVKTLF